MPRPQASRLPPAPREPWLPRERLEGLPFGGPPDVRGGSFGNLFLGRRRSYEHDREGFPNYYRPLPAHHRRQDRIFLFTAERRLALAAKGVDAFLVVATVVD